MFDYKWLQLFAEGEGGEAATGDTAGAADQYTENLVKLGVPRDKIRAKSPAAKPAQPAQQVEQVQQQETEQAAAATEQKRMTWEEIMADSEYNEAMQKVVSERLKKSKAAQKEAEDKLGKLAPALEVMARKYGMDVNDLDFDKLATAVSEDAIYYEQKAMDMGVSVETAKHIDQLERESARRKAEEAKSVEDQAMRQHFQRLAEQAEKLKETFPNFDLMKEMENPAFARMTAPNMPISLEDAYYAVHRKEIQQASMQVAAQKTAENLSKTIQAGQKRPVENGTSAQAPSITTIDWRNASREQREAQRARIKQAAAQGKKLYPGTF